MCRINLVKFNFAQFSDFILLVHAHVTKRKFPDNRYFDGYNLRLTEQAESARIKFQKSDKIDGITIFEFVNFGDLATSEISLSLSLVSFT